MRMEELRYLVGYAFQHLNCFTINFHNFNIKYKYVVKKLDISCLSEFAINYSCSERINFLSLPRDEYVVSRVTNITDICTKKNL